MQTGETFDDMRCTCGPGKLLAIQFRPMPSERVQRKVDTFLDEAESALARNEWRVARERARAALALDPANDDAKHYLESAERGESQPASPTSA